MARVLIMGAAGKDFHVFNTCFRERADDEVVAFTAAQIPDIAGRRYPPSLAGDRYPEGIAILDEADLASIIAERAVDRVVFAYSDVSEDYLAEREETVRRAGATFERAPVEPTMIAASKPVVAICAVRTGCGKSQTTRHVAAVLRDLGHRVVVVRHPMPYGDLAKQRVQRFATLADLQRHHCTIEEMEEYEPHIVAGSVVYAGVDYGAILEDAEAEADIILWDGGNNDTPFYRPDLWICIADPLRAGHELSHYPGRVNFERADVIVLNKMDSASDAQVETVRANANAHNADALIVEADSAITVGDPSIIEGKRVLAIEDGPTCTHGGMKIGAATVAARRLGASAIVDPRPFAVGSIAATFAQYPDIGPLLPAMGYGPQQIDDLERTIAAADVDAVVVGTPIDLSRVVRIDKPHTRVSYDLAERGTPNLRQILEDRFGPRR
jgi:predicted GTPase